MEEESVSRPEYRDTSMKLLAQRSESTISNVIKFKLQLFRVNHCLYLLYEIPFVN